MAALTWDKSGERYYETGVSKGVLYPLRGGRYGTGVPWNGLTAVNESSSGAEVTPMYADNTKYLNLMSVEDFKATIEAYNYPDEFAQCDGSEELAVSIMIGQQKRKPFGFCYRTEVGNDTEDMDAGYKIHLVFYCMAAPTDRSYATVNESPDAMTFSWELTTLPVEIDGCKPSATLVLDSRRFKKSAITNVLKHIEDILYGTQTTDPTFPKVSEILDVYDLEMYIRDSSNDTILDSDGNMIQSRVL